MSNSEDVARCFGGDCSLFEPYPPNQSSELPAPFVLSGIEESASQRLLRCPAQEVKSMDHTKLLGLARPLAPAVQTGHFHTSEAVNPADTCIAVPAVHTSSQLAVGTSLHVAANYTVEPDAQQEPDHTWTAASRIGCCGLYPGLHLVY